MKFILNLLAALFNLWLIESAICQTDSAKIDALFLKGESCSSKMDFDSAIITYLQAKSLCESQKIWDKYVRCNNELGLLMQKKNLQDSSCYYYWKSYKKALQIWDPENPKMAACYFNIGVVYDFKDPINGNLDSALHCFKMALKLWTKTYGELHPLVAKACRRIAFNYQARIQLTESLKWFSKVSEIETSLYGKENKSASGGYGNIGLAYLNLGNYEKALEYLNKSLSIELSYNPLSKKAAAAYNNIGLIYLDYGDLDEALDYEKKGLEIRLKILPENDEDISSSYNNISSIYYQKRDYKNALDNEKKALTIRQTIYGNEHFITARSYNNIALYYYETCDYQKALELQFKALKGRTRTLPALNPEIAESYTNLGNIYEKTKDYKEAIKYYRQTENIIRNLYNENHEESAIVCNNLGAVYYSLEKFDSAIWFFKKSADIYRYNFGNYHPELALRLNSIAEAYLLTDSLNSAIYFNNSALQAIVTKGSRTFPIEKIPFDSILFKPALFEILSLRADILIHKSVMEKTKTHRLEAMEIYKYLIVLSETIRSGFDTEQSKFIFAETMPATFTQAINNCFAIAQLNEDTSAINQAFSFCQQLKAGVLLESIIECDAKKFAGIPDSILLTERNLKIGIASMETRQKEMIYKNNQNTDSIDNIIFDKKNDYKNILSIIKEKYPKYHQLKTKSYIPSAANICNKLLPNEAIVEYILSDSVLFIFTLTDKGVDLKKVATGIEFPNLIKRYLSSINKIQLQELPALSNELYRNLIEPVIDKIKDKTKICIIPNNELWYLPFESLFPKNNYPITDFTKPDYLIKHFDISYHLSSSIWYLNSKKEMNYRVNNTNVDFMGFAPVFDNRIAQNDSFACIFYTDSIGNETATRGFTENTWQLRPLPYSKDEIVETSVLFQKNKKATATFFYKEANKTNLFEAGKNCRILHIATHGIMNPDEPALSGIFLAPINADNTGSSIADNQILYASETYNLTLNANLLVLSACETGTGKLLLGEGITSLVRGFIYAGVPNIIYSTWKIGDKNTKQLMVNFYKEYLSKNNYSNALRKAKLELISKPETAFPKNWAGLALIGN